MIDSLWGQDYVGVTHRNKGVKVNSHEVIRYPPQKIIPGSNPPPDPKGNMP